MKNKKLVICLDGLGYSMLSRKDTPFLWSFAKNNCLARLKTLLAFTGIEFSFFSGRFPDEHDVWIEFVHSPETSPFKWQKNLRFLGAGVLSKITAVSMLLRGKNFITKLYSMPYDKMGLFDAVTESNIWEQEMFKGRNYVCLKWPFLVKNGSKKIITKYLNDKERCKMLVNSIDDETEIYSAQLLTLDKIMHIHGHGQEGSAAARKLDDIAKYVVTEFTEKIPDIEIVLWSDHGFVDVKSHVDVQAAMPKRDDYTSFYGGTTVSFWFATKEARREVESALSKLKFGKILSGKELKKYHIPSGLRHGEMIFAVEPGFMIFPNYYESRPGEKFRSMHGYRPDRCDSDGILLTNIKLKKDIMEMPEALGAINMKSG